MISKGEVVDKYSRIREHLYRECRQRVLPEPPEDHFPANLAHTLDEIPSHDHDDQARLLISLMHPSVWFNLLNDGSKSDLAGESKTIECPQEGKGYNYEHGHD